jgi:hypothetical protein
MSNWKESFDSLQLQQGFEAAIKQWEACSIEGLDPKIIGNYRRLLKALKLVAARIGIIDPELYSPNTWGNFPAFIQNIKNYAESFRKSRNVSFIQQANDQIDQSLNVLRPLELQHSPEIAKALESAAGSFQQKMIELLEDVKAKGKESKAEVRTLGQQVEALKAQIQESNQVIQQQKTRLDQAISEHQKQFSSAQEKRTSDFAQAMMVNTEHASQQQKEFETRFSEAGAKWKNEYELLFRVVSKESEAHREFLKKREEEVNKIFGAIGTTAFAGNFKVTADNEAGAANLWRWIALGLMAAMIVVGGYAFYYSIGHETDWRVFAFRLGTVIVLAIPAIYAANESSKHRERERLNRKIHLELASIDAYLVLLPEEQRNRIKSNLAEKFFGVPFIKEKMDEVDKKDLFSLLSSVLNNLTKGK